MSADHGLYMPDGSHRVTVVNAATPIELTGDLSVDVWGAVDDASETDPDAASATIASLLRGILESQAAQTAIFADILAELEAHTVLLTSIETNTA